MSVSIRMHLSMVHRRSGGSSQARKIPREDEIQVMTGEAHCAQGSYLARTSRSIYIYIYGFKGSLVSSSSYHSDASSPIRSTLLHPAFWEELSASTP